MEQLKTCKKGHEYLASIEICRVCHRARTRAWIKANPDKQKKMKSSWYKANRDKNKEGDSRRHKRWKEDNRDRVNAYSRAYYKSNSTKHSAITRNWRINNLPKLAALSAKRRSKQLQATPSWLTAQHLDHMEFFYNCAKDLENMFGTKWHVDHIIPLQGKNVSGLHVPWNLQVIRAEENLKKSNKLEQALA